MYSGCMSIIHLLFHHRLTSKKKLSDMCKDRKMKEPLYEGNCVSLFPEVGFLGYITQKGEKSIVEEKAKEEAAYTAFSNLVSHFTSPFDGII